MKRKSQLTLAGMALAVASVFAAATPAVAYDTGSRYCNYGYDAYTAAGNLSVGTTIIHKQTNLGVTQVGGAYTQINTVRTMSWGYQSFSASSVSDGNTRYTGCA